MLYVVGHSIMVLVITALVGSTIGPISMAQETVRLGL